MLSLLKKKTRLIYIKIISLFFLLIFKKPRIIFHNEKIKNLYKIYKIKFGWNNYYIYRVIKGRIFTNAVDDFGIICKNYLIPEASYQYRSAINSNIRNNIILRTGTPKFLKKIKGRVLSLLAGGGANKNYHHWLLDVLPKIYLLKKKKLFEKIDYFLVPSYESEFQIKTLKILGIQKKKILESKKYKHLIADEIYSTSEISDISFNNIFYWNINFIRKTFLRSVQNRKLHFNYKKVYLDRGEGHLVKNNNDLYSLKDNYRLIINEDEIKSYLISRGFKIVKSQDLSFLDQIDLFSNLDCLISLHGAGLTNLIFSKPKTKVIEIRTENNTNNFPYKISKLLRLNYHSINLKTVYKTKATQNGLVICPLSKIIKKMSLLKI
jgi:hypothetical protein